MYMYVLYFLIVKSSPDLYTGDEMCIETEGKIIKDEDEDIYQFLPTRQDSQDQEEILEGSVANDVTVRCEFEPYTQIWLCGRGDRKGVLQVFTYNDGHIGHCVSYIRIIMLLG